MISPSDSLKNQFQLDPTFTYLNHGSFGSCPIPIFEERNKWQLELEKHPVSFIEDKAANLLDWSREALASFIHCNKDDVVYFPNPTTAMNMVVRSLDLKPGDEVLTSSHEYGAVDRTWKFMSRKKGFLYKSVDIPIPFSKDDFMNELTRLASRINVDVETLKNICASNDLDFELIESQIKTELLWNSLIFQLYGSRLSINVEEIEEQLNIIQNKKEAVEYLISEIVIKPVEKDKFKSVINELKNKIKIEGFEKVATKLSISKTGEKGGDLGWLNENVILEKYLSEIVKTQVGKISEPIIVPDGILIFKIRDKRNIKRNLEEEKNKLVNAEKTKILKMHASSHYDKLKRSVSIKFLNE